MLTVFPILPDNIEVNFESLLNYFTHHVESIIQWVFLLILALTGLLISRGLFGKQDKASGGGASAGASNSPEVQSVLQQILDRTSKLDGVAVTSQMSPEAVALAETQVQTLKKELSARDEEIKTLKSTAATTGGAAGAAVSDEANKLAARLKELEAKLAEYEILEDDIADLSLYKEENVRLRSELDKLKGGATAPAVASATAATAAVEPAPAPPAAAPKTDDIVAEFAQAVSQDGPPAPTATMEVPDTGNPMKDFEAAVAIEKQRAAAPTPQPAAPAPEAPAPAPQAAPTPAAPVAAPAAAKAATPSGPSDDLFAEFAESPATPSDASLDTDKMMAEMAALVSLEPATGNSLEDGIDTDKMAAEAGSFNKG